MRYQGKIIKKPFAVGSKSEHDAVMLVTASGEYVLQREGGNAFQDPLLDQLVGKMIACDGQVHGHTLIMSTWEQLKE